MPGKVGVKIKAGRNLPVMDRGSDTTDAFVEIKLGNTTHKTEVCRKSLNPQFNTDWFRFEVDDAELQDEPLQIRLMDHDTYSANDAIGKVNISLNPLCLETDRQATNGKSNVLSGWIPVFDTMHGIRGEVNVIVKVDLFSDLNKFRQSSCGIPFFHSPCVPFGFRAQIIHGFVEELVVNDDPEYQWIDKIRTPRASNEARQAVFLQLSGQVQRKMGLKAINMGANAVIGYTICFDLEGDVGVVVRGIGTAVTLIKDMSSNQQIATSTNENALIEERSKEYLNFLMCTNDKTNSKSKSKSTLSLAETSFQNSIYKCRSASNFVDLKHESSLATEDETAEFVVSLMRQEDERGEKPTPKLKQQMRRFTRSSRNLFNEKYAAIKRKMGDGTGSKSPDSISMLSFASLVSAAGSTLCKSDSSTSTLNSVYSGRQRKRSFKLKSKVKGKQLPPGTKTVHTMVRSLSNDSAMRNKEAKQFCVPRIAVISEYQENARSTPDIFTSETESVLDSIASSHELPLPVQRFGDTGVESSSTLSLTVTESSSSSADEDETEAEAYAIGYNMENADDKVEAAQKLAMMLKMIDEEDVCNENWIQPGETTGVDEDSLTDLTKNNKRHLHLLSDLKAFSQHLQGYLKPRKVNTSTAITTSTGVAMLLPALLQCEKPPNKLLLNPLSAQTRNSFYCSQPEFLNEIDTNNSKLDSVSTNVPAISHSRSLLNLKALVKPPNAFEKKTALTTDDLSTSNSISNQNQTQTKLKHPTEFQAPILQICPSTPTPTPSESDTLLTPTEECMPGALVADVPPSTQSFVDTADIVHSLVLEHVGSLKTHTSKSLPLHTNDTYCLSSPSHSGQKKIINKPKNSNQNFNNTLFNTTNRSDKPSLLVPSLTITTSTVSTATTALSHSQLPSPHTPHTDAAAIISRNRHHNRSLNEISSMNGTTDSPSMKRFASPASAAVVAAGSNTNANANSDQTQTAMGAPVGTSSRLTPSPSKIGVTSPGDNVSSTTTTSTSTTSAATMIPKDVGEICRRSSDSDLSVTPKGNSICVASERLVAATAMMRLSQPISGKNSTGANADSMDSMLEYPFLTMTRYPVGFILHLGATVAARSVKLLERVAKIDEPELRDSWWTELRMEIRSHARALGCNVVLGYSESTTISDDVCVLSATGTAAVINMAYNRSVSQQDIYTSNSIKGVAVGVGVGVGISTGMSTSLEEREILKEARNGVASVDAKDTNSTYGGSGPSAGSIAGKKNVPLIPLTAGKSSSSCTICHVPYNLTSVPFNVKMKRCGICRKGRVPDVLLSTLEVPEFLQVTGRGCFMQAQVVRAKKDLRSELNAKEISDVLPFLEYELHRVLINKLKAKGMNAIFGLRTQVAIGERVIALVATGTALFLSALPVPQVPRIVAGNSWTDKQKLNELQKKLQETYERNQRVYQLKCIDPDMDANTMTNELSGQKQSDTDESDDEVVEIDLNCGNKDTCVLEVDDIEDLEIISLLMEPYPPEGFHVVNTQTVPGMLDMEAIKNLQMFTQIWRAKLDVGQQTINGFPKHFQRILQTIYFKLRTMIPCAICDLRFRLDLPESDQIQLLVTGMALGLSDISKSKSQRRKQQSQQIASNPSSNNLKLNTKSAATTNGISNNNEDAINGTQTMNSGGGSGGGGGSNVGGGIGNKRPLQEEDYIFPLDEDHMVETPTPTSNLPPYGSNSFKLRKTSPSRTTSMVNASLRTRYYPLRDRGVDITPLSFIPAGRIEKYLGNLNFFFIRESTSIRENGGISGFVHSFVTELLAVVRANIAAIGGNAMVSFYMNELVLVDNQHKNQGQCLVSIGGDAVFVSYSNDE